MRKLWALSFVVTTGCGISSSLPLPLPPSNLEWGIRLYRQGRFHQAALVLEQATSAARDDPKAWTYLGLAEIGRGEPDRALAALATAVEIAPDFAEGRFARGLAYRRLGRTADAIAELEVAVGLNPTHAEAHHELGLACLEAGGIDPGIAHLTRFLELKPRSPEAEQVRELLEQLGYQDGNERGCGDKKERGGQKSSSP